MKKFWPARRSRVWSETTFRELGRRVALSAPALGRRLRRLEEEGAIRAYAAEVHPAALGFTLSAFVVTTRSAHAGARLRDASRRCRR
jgi:DNA-binding Lrp family transcriptional regulator